MIKKNTENADNLKCFCESSGHAEIKVSFKLGQIHCAFDIIAAFSKCNYYQLQFFSNKHLKYVIMKIINSCHLTWHGKWTIYIGRHCKKLVVLKVWFRHLWGSPRPFEGRLGWKYFHTNMDVSPLFLWRVLKPIRCSVFHSMNENSIRQVVFH